MKELYFTSIKTPIGYLELKSDPSALVSISFVDKLLPSSGFQPLILKKSCVQLDEYFNGVRNVFKLNLNPIGTEFQKNVWEQLLAIPFGKTASYLDIAIQVGSKNKTRAVGLANGKNPIPIIIPCHRIIGANKKLTGYAGGIEKKRWLLQHELNYSNNNNILF